MIPDCKKPKFGQLNPVDRISDLPDFILHHIFSFLDGEAASRTSVLSKRWTQVTATNPVLSFHSRRFSNETTASFVDRIESTMQRYSNENLLIRKFTLDFICFDDNFACKVDEWLEIVVNAQVTELLLSGSANFQLLDTLFSARWLTRLQCSNIKLPYNKTMDLVSLELLILDEVRIEDRMLNHMISSCISLTVLRLSYCCFYECIVIPRHSKLETLDLIETLPLGGEVIVKTSSLKNFKARNRKNMCWPIIFEPGLLRNLKILHISLSYFTDVDFAVLLHELALLETLVFRSCKACDELNNINISSTRLKKICLDDCSHLSHVAIDAPSLQKFRFNGEQLASLSVTTNNQANCVISLHILPVNLDTDGFLELKRLLIELDNINLSLKILLLDETSEFEIFPNRVKSKCDVIEFDEEELGEEEFSEDEFDEEELVSVYMGPPCKIRKLKLNISSWILSESSLSAFLDGLFWSCHPDIISIRVDLHTSNETILSLIRKLENMARSLKHPLKRVEGGNNCFDVLKAYSLDVELRLYW